MDSREISRDNWTLSRTSASAKPPGRIRPQILGNSKQRQVSIADLPRPDSPPPSGLERVHEVTKIGNTRTNRALRNKRGRRVKPVGTPAEEKERWAKRALEKEGGKE